MNPPNRYNPVTCKNFSIYVLDSCVVHLIPEVRKLLWERGYVLIIIRGSIIATAWGNPKVKHPRAFKSLFVTNSLEGPGDYFFSERVFKLIGESIISFREKLIETETVTKCLILLALMMINKMIIRTCVTT